MTRLWGPAIDTNGYEAAPVDRNLARGEADFSAIDGMLAWYQG
jgi:hypothetical protein